MQIILPPKSVRLHETTPSMAAQSVIARMYGLYNVRPGYFYPQSPYGRTLGIRGLRGLGFSYYDLLAQAGMEDCDPKDTPCVARNQQRQIAVEDLWTTKYMTDPNTANQTAPSITVNTDSSQAAVNAFKANQPLTTETIDVHGQPAQSVQQLESSPFYSRQPAQSGGSYNPRVTFQTSTGDTGQLKPGDTWTISISGGQPGGQVTVTGGQNGQNITTPMGNADGNGNWTATGSIDTTMMGNWKEEWSVAGKDAGGFGFTVVPANQTQGSAATGKPNQSVPPGNSLVPGNTGFQSTGSFFQQIFGGTDSTGATVQPNYMLLALLGVGAVLLLKGK